MRSILPILTLLALSISSACATALTYRLVHNEKSCFFTETQREESKVAFYFAVQSGGNFEIDYEVRGPHDKLILSGDKERQGDFVFTAQETGEYRFCFSNEGYTASDKDVDFEIAVEDESRSALLPTKGGTSPEQTSALEDTIFKVSSQLSTVSRMQKYFRTRENRNFSTVRSTESRIFNFSMVEVAMMVGMAALQVLVVRFFFQGARKGYV